MLALLLLSGTMMCACGGNSSGSGGSNPPPTTKPTAATPTITTANAKGGAVIVTLADTTNGATIHYTLDGSAPSSSSEIYQAPFLVSSSITVKAIATASSYTDSAVASQAFTPNIASGTLVWSDEFSNAGGTNAGPNASTWTYDVGTNCCGNNELETYCAWGSTAASCDSNNPNAYIGTDSFLHIVARNPSSTVYTSARLKSQGLFSFMYGRIEARMKLPESQGMWPAFWLLGNNIATISWPACGELDVMEHIDGNNPPLNGSAPGYDWIAGSVHGGTSSSKADGTQQYHAAGFTAAEWHTYGMIWSKGKIEYYVDDPANIYATFTPANFSGTWPFDVGPQFIILNLAVGGDWPGGPNATTVFPGDMTVDYVRIYTN
ncbi:family 16 glycosylhydrolase [Occallatibacter riparius]|uniref:Family 16 glycosylhydrolase n=1 Tax=Occallatibacter riparius TaxID=1002689 RepID=A0A9J7BH65_9BACT|nr:family 16 glycosylhydrolase [Occallatibacter riparius]UWZ82316.1 family 16 glycosylhydrolase [Occallatibacter riparius]